MSNFWQRTLTGAVFVALLAGSILLHPLAFCALFLIVSVLAMIEFQTIMTSESVSIQKFGSLLLGVSVFLAPFFYRYDQLDPKWMLLIVPFAVAVFISELYRKHERPFINIALTIITALYVVLPFVFLVQLGFVGGEGYYFLIPLIFFCMIWVNDTGAYLVGMSIGKRRLFPRISPKKSWEGFFGGVALTLILAVVLSFYVDRLTQIDLIVMAVIIAVFGTLGDLTESMLKRSMNVKDSGTLIPGHGGILDRFDALTFAAPLVYVYFELFK